MIDPLCDVVPYLDAFCTVTHFLESPRSRHMSMALRDLALSTVVAVRLWASRARIPDFDRASSYRGAKRRRRLMSGCPFSAFQAHRRFSQRVDMAQAELEDRCVVARLIAGGNRRIEAQMYSSLILELVRGQAFGFECSESLHIASRRSGLPMFHSSLFAAEAERESKY